MFLKMLNKQDQLNSDINPLWKYERSLDDFSTAIFTEVAEFIESTDWKWWKDFEIDMFNAKLELVDIFHFLLSYLILYKELPVNKENFERQITYLDLAELLEKSYNRANTSVLYLTDIKRFACEIERYTNSGVSFDYMSLKFVISDFFSVVKKFFDNDKEEFFKFYLIKLALNHYRKQSGYKSGSYNKVVNGIEDNVSFFNKVINKVNLNDSEEDVINKFKEDTVW